MKNLVLLCGLGLLMSCQEPVSPDEPIIRPVRSVVLDDSAGQTPTRVFTGISRASEESKLSFRVGGALRTLNVKQGDKIEKDQEIAWLDASDLKLKAQQAADAVAQAKAAQHSAQAEFDRIRQLYESSSASRSQYDQARNALDQAKAGGRSSRKQLQLARKQVGYTRLTAPTDGVVSKVMSQAGENVGPGQTVMTLASGGAPEVVVGVAGTFISQIKVGDAVKVLFKDIKDKTFEATVQEIGITPETQQTTFPVIAGLSVEDEAVRLGMAVEVIFEVKDEAELGGLFVPSTAVAENAQGIYVFTVEDIGNGLGLVHKKPVTVLEQLSARGVRVTVGLKSGDRVVTAGVSRIIEGQKVRLLEGRE